MKKGGGGLSLNFPYLDNPLLDDDDETLLRLAAALLLLVREVAPSFLPSFRMTNRRSAKQRPKYLRSPAILQHHKQKLLLAFFPCVLLCVMCVICVCGCESM